MGMFAESVDGRPARLAALAFALAGALTSGCGGGSDDASHGSKPYSGYESEVYSNDAMWLCKPGLERDYCFDDTTATEATPDGRLEPVPREPTTNGGTDCFYVYPTVALSGPAGNQDDFSDITPMLDPLLNQAAHFTSLCTVYAPLYRQVTLAGFQSAQAEEYLEVAYEDVLDAFKHYMAQHNRGRQLVLMGHSQGTRLLRRLVQREIDGTPELLERLVVALLIGGDVFVPRGETVGGSFENVPLCSHEEETGCAIAYRSYAEGFAPTGGTTGAFLELPEGMDTACSNLGATGEGETRFGATYLPTFAHQPIFDVGAEVPPGVDTPFVLYKNFYAGECTQDATGASYLEIRVRPETDDQRTNPVPFDAPLLSPSLLGLHVLDYNFPMAELTGLVRSKAAAAR